MFGDLNFHLWIANTKDTLGFYVAYNLLKHALYRLLKIAACVPRTAHSPPGDEGICVASDAHKAACLCGIYYTS